MNIKVVLGGFVVAVLAVGSLVGFWLTQNNIAQAPVTNTGTVAPAPAPTPVAEPPVITPVAPVVGTVFKNAYMQVTVPEGWTLTEATQTLQDQRYDQLTGKTVKVGEPKTTKTGAVNITKGKYILYIHPQASQASGVDGGRFAEIAMGAPSADAVVIEQPNPPCGTEKTSPVKVGWTRHDWYVSGTDKKVEYCAVPSGSAAVWYFSYVTDVKNGYINYNSQGSLPGWVITMGYNSKTVNSLPPQNSPELITALTEMTDIVKTLELKQLAK